jgi:hypothetical protein
MLGVAVILVIVAAAIIGSLTGKSKHAAAPSAAPPTTRSAAPVAKKKAAPAPKPASTGPANIPGFSGPAAPGHIFGDCRNSSVTSDSSGITVQVGYDGPALVNVSLFPKDGYDIPFTSSQSNTIPAGMHGQPFNFPAFAHLDYAQVNVDAGGKSLTCDAEVG